MPNIKINNALISVSNKNDIESIAKKLKKFNVQIISTGGTAQFLEKKNITVTEIESLTNFPEIFDGRVKTLHPIIYGGILNRRCLKKDQKIVKKYNITNIDLIIINLYDFENTSKRTKSSKKIIENIDIGGPSLIRAAAKNFLYTTVVVDPNDYKELLNQMENNNGTNLDFREYLAKKAFELTYKYDNKIFEWFNNGQVSSKKTIPDSLTLNLKKKLSMRYGENPHQKGGLYISDQKTFGVPYSKQIQGKELSYNNINDVDAAFNLISEFVNPAVAIIKHANPCGVSEAINIETAWVNALKTDTASAFGGIVAVNRKINKNLAKELSKIFLEVIIAPGITEESKKILSSKINLRILICNKFPNSKNQELHIKSISGGFLIQTEDNGFLKKRNLKVVTNRKPTSKERKDLMFAWIIAKHTKSNAIVFAKDKSTIGIGAGQMSRIDSAYIAKKKSEKVLFLKSKKYTKIHSSVMASDAFFPFPDALITAADSGITAVIQPGGSVHDQEIIDEANKRNLAMIFTSIRHFKH